MTFQTDNTLITNREMFAELAAVTGRVIKSYASALLGRSRSAKTAK
ncbi:hypothetical protein [Yoonia sp. SS1-5]|uniref:Uncharacterized protein n=1 Tax=Yoonia rhodophyticola TaxID=3137370 RepID=A0ABZ3JBJ3_9RHOB